MLYQSLKTNLETELNFKNRQVTPNLRGQGEINGVTR